MDMRGENRALTVPRTSLILHAELDRIPLGRRPDETLPIVNFHLIRCLSIALSPFLSLFLPIPFSTPVKSQTRHSDVEATRSVLRSIKTNQLRLIGRSCHLF